MTLFDPEILAEGHGLSLLPCAGCLVVGLSLWLFGWRLHRFWLVLLSALAAGIIGLKVGPDYGMQPLVAALLLGLAAGVMAVTLMRVLAFAAGGVAGYLLVHSLAPTWNQPVVGILAGGLLGVVLFRVWIMALTSFGGTLLLGYGSLWMAHQPGGFSAADWAGEHVSLLNVLALGATVLGVIVQLFLDRLRAKLQKQRKQREEEQTRLAEEEIKRQTRKKGFFGFLRKAG
jgi:hypothetical protein